MIPQFSVYLRGLKKSALLSALFVAIEALCQLLIPLLMADLISLGLMERSIFRIYRYGIRLSAMAVLAMVFGILASRFAFRVSQGFEARLRAHLFETVLTAPSLAGNGISSASLIIRLTDDVNALSMLLMLFLRVFLRAVISLPISFILCIKLNAVLGSITFGTILLTAFFVILMMLQSIPFFNEMQERTDSLNMILQENLTAIQTVRAFSQGARECARFREKNELLKKAGIKAGLRVAAVMPTIMLLMNISIILILYFGGPMVMKRDFDIASLQAFLSYGMQVISGIMMLAMSFFQISRSFVSAKRISGILSLEAPGSESTALERDMGTVCPAGASPCQNSERQKPTPSFSLRGKLSFQSLSFHYPGNRENMVLDRITFTAEAGQITAIVGGTGSGKSTLLSLIPRLLDYSEGHLLLDGTDIREISPFDLRNIISFVPQNCRLFSGSIRENLLFGNGAADDDLIRHALEAAQADEFIRSMPCGLDTVLSQGGANLSDGQRQRLCIARALLRNTPLLILDDTTSSVDARTESRICQSLRKEAGKRSILMVSQRVSAVKNADCVYVLDNGRIIASGTHSSLMKESQLYRSLFLSQHRSDSTGVTARDVI